MNNNILFDFIENVELPFGNEEVDSMVKEMNINTQCEKGDCKLCRDCKAVTPESMKYFICDEVSMEEENFYCNWCEFIRTTGIDSAVIESINHEREKRTDSLDIDEYEDDGYAAMRELEDSGAFSDEGIMPGCHSNDWEYESEMRAISQEFEDMAFVGKCIRMAREKVGLAIEDISIEFDLPESIIRNIEKGEYIDYNEAKSYEDNVIYVSVKSITPVAVSAPVDNKVSGERYKAIPWWDNLGEWTMREKLADYLREIINPRKSKEQAKKLVEINDNDVPF